jgi:hypothetical protein
MANDNRHKAAAKQVEAEPATVMRRATELSEGDWFIVNGVEWVMAAQHAIGPAMCVNLDGLIVRRSEFDVVTPLTSVKITYSVPQ